MSPTLVTRLLPQSMRHGLRRLQTRYRHQYGDVGRLWLKTGLHWSVDDVSLAGDSLEISGWAYVPPENRERVGFTWNDRSFEHVEYGLPRPDLADAMPFIEGIANTAFRCQARLPAGRGPAADHLTFRCIDRETGRPLTNPNHPYCFQPPAAGDVIPEPTRRVRVMWYAAEASFRISGYTIYNQLRRALTHTVGRDITHFEHVLDWGCGCGRVSRYFRPPAAFSGADVDPDNVQWCQEHLAYGRYLTIPLYPPTAVPDATFDMIFGISVMTHLREATQMQWLAELHRIARPGAIVMLTFHGDASACLHQPERRVWRHLERTGFVDTSNTVYDAALDEKDYYRNILQTTDHVRRHWSRSFQVLDILPCYIFHQDMAILRKA